VGLIVVLALWCALAVLTALLVGRFLSYSARRDREFVRTAQEAVEADRIRPTAS
jgi:hypothetical protein